MFPAARFRDCVSARGVFSMADGRAHRFDHKAPGADRAPLSRLDSLGRVAQLAREVLRQRGLSEDQIARELDRAMRDAD